MKHCVQHCSGYFGEYTPMHTHTCRRKKINPHETTAEQKMINLKFPKGEQISGCPGLGTRGR